RLVDLGHPLMGHDLLVVALAARREAEGVEVGEEGTSWFLLDVKTGQTQQPTRMMAGVNDFRLNLDGGATDVGGDGQLADVEAEIVETTDALVDPPPAALLEPLPSRELAPHRRGAGGGR